MRVTALEINENQFKRNIKEIKNIVGNKLLMPVIKANAYGTHINKRLNIINEFEIVAVALVDEAVELRKIGYKKEIFILNQPYIEEIDEIIKYDLIIGLSSKEFLNKIINTTKKIRVHLEIETGMNRTGIKLDELDDFIKNIKSNNSIIVEGIYTHLSSADFDKEYTYKQLEKFSLAVSSIKKNFNTIKYIHSSASNGLLKFDDNVSNMVRPGLIMYGYETFEGVKNIINIKPVATLKSKITYIKDVEKGEAISYSQKYIAKEKIRVATIPIGYADGLRRELSNKGYFVINNKKVPIIGNICMDNCMIDVTGVEEVEVGTDVYVWDNDIITIEDVAKMCNTINYEILCTISGRVRRNFVEEK